MANQQVINYIKQNLAQGQKEDDVRRTLAATGWPAQEIEAAFAEVKGASAPSGPGAFSVFPGVFDTLKSAWEIYKQRFWVIVKLALIPMAAIAVPMAILTFFWGIFSTIKNSSSPVSVEKFFSIYASALSSGIMPIIFFVLFIILTIAAIIVGIWSQAAMLVAIRDRRENIGAKESLRRAWPKASSYLWVSFLVGFIAMGGFMLAIVPGIIFGIWFSLGIYVLMAEDVKGMNALLKSKEYVSGRWWSVFWRFFGFGLMVMAVSLIINFIPFVNFVSGFVSAFVFSPLGLIYGFLVYNNLKSLKGEFEFVPKKRGLFIFFGVLGFMLVPVSLITTIVLVGLNTARQKARDAAVRSAVQQTGIVAGYIYDRDNSSYVKLCGVDNRLNAQDLDVGQDLAKIQETVSKTGGKETCYVSEEKNYCVSASLEVGVKKSFCADGSGFVGEKICRPSGLCQ